MDKSTSTSESYTPEFIIYLSNKDIVELKNFETYDKDDRFITGEGIDGRTYYVNRDFVVKISED